MRLEADGSEKSDSSINLSDDEGKNYVDSRKSKTMKENQIGKGLDKDEYEESKSNSSDELDSEEDMNN